MKKNIGSIINIGSVAAFRGSGMNVTTYTVTKAAVVQLTRGCALDIWDKYKIRVNSVCPGS